MKLYELVIKEPKITSKYGYRIHPIKKKRLFHAGIDLISKVGNRNLYAVSDGYVQKVVKSNTGYGNYVWIRYPDYNLSLLYAHCASIKVTKGQKVKKGQVVAIEGKSGAATGVHLHLGMTKIGSNTYLNPENYNVITEKKTYYVVKKGDTLTKIAKKYKTTIAKLVKLNGLKNPNVLKVGQKLRVK